MIKRTIPEMVREAETNYTSGGISISEYVEWDMHDTIERIDAYLNSKHISGEKDSLGREKPFFNITTAAANIWYRATDLDRKNVRILPDKSSNTGIAFIATVLLREWMRKSRFGVFLNDWGRTLARFGSAVVKFVEKDGELVAYSVPWNRLIVDPIDFDALPTIEKIYLTPEQLAERTEYDQDVVEELMQARSSRKTIDGHNKDNNNGFIELYEVHGRLPLSELTDNEEDEDTYVQQMHVITYMTNDDGEIEDYTVFRGREAKHPYMITHLIKEDGRTLSIGAVEHLFEAQWMTNHSQKNIKDTLDLASKLIFQTSDGAYVGRNVLTAIETGQVMVHGDNQPLTRLANDKPDISAFQNFQAQWQNIATEITSTPDAIRGSTLPSGTPYSLGAFLGAQANSLFEIMTENKGLHLEDMMREYVIPHLLKKMDTKDEVVAILDDQQIAEIDAKYVPRAAIKRYNDKVKKQLIEGDVPSPYQPGEAQAEVRRDLAELGNTRMFKPSDIDNKTWKQALKNFNMTAVVEVTNEESDKQAVLTTLSSVLQTIAGNPQILQDPNAKMVFNQILTETGRISPIQLSSSQAQTPQLPQGGQGGADALTAITDQNNNAQ